MDYGLFGDAFDFNGDGGIDAFEHAAEWHVLAQMSEAERKNHLQMLGISEEEFYRIYPDAKRKK